MSRLGSRLGIALAAFAGVAVLAFLNRAYFDPMLRGLNDFPAFYCAPRLLGTGALYDPVAMAAEQIRILGVRCDNIQYIRLPFVAVLFSPLSYLPYWLAYMIWQLSCLGALAGFVLLWPARPVVTLLLCCWFPPVAASFLNGQDVPFLLLWIAVGARLVRRGNHFAAGLVLALLLAKPHLFLFIPVVLVAGRFWKLAAGIASGCSVLLLASFAIAGWGWPTAFSHALVNPSVHPSLSVSFLGSLRNLELPVTVLGVVLAFTVLAAGFAVWHYSRRSDFPAAFGAAAGIGTLTAFHVYLQDYLLWLPAVSLLLSRLSAGRRARDAAENA